MSEENNAEVSQEQPAVPSLDDVASQFAADLPDPEQTTPAESFQNAEPATSNDDVVSQVQALSAQLEAIQQEKAQEQFKADLNSAVDLLAKESGLEDKRYVEFRLNQMAAENPNFEKIWQNRHLRPDALEATLKAAANEMKGELSFKQDPQLAENHRAAQESTNTSATTAAPEFNNDWEEKLANASSQTEKEAIWHQLSRGG